MAKKQENINQNPIASEIQDKQIQLNELGKGAVINLGESKTKTIEDIKIKNLNPDIQLEVYSNKRCLIEGEAKITLDTFATVYSEALFGDNGPHIMYLNNMEIQGLVTFEVTTDEVKVNID